ncbi:MAG TPA: outer membrane lipoprotein carrier protein LolA [Chitinophagales bacterium]|nr:outer membrane lipoprotein carrier protein LolA [Chitinophagales bacterium]
MIRHILFSCIAILYFSGVVAKTEQNNVANMNDPKAKEVLDKSSAAYQQNTAIYSKFTQSIEVPGGKTNNKSGEIYIKANKYKIKFSDQEIYCNEKSVWTYLKDVNEVQINDYESDPSDMTPNNMFNIYQKDFNYIKINDENVLDKPCSVIDLSPKDKSRSYFKVRLWINKQTNLLSRIKIFDKNGYRYTYTINSINIHSKVNDSEFNFDKNKYPGVHIEDLRF